MAGRAVMARPSLRRVAAVSAVALIALGCVGVGTASSLRYGLQSFGDPTRAALVDVPGASQHHMVSKLEALKKTPRRGVILSDATWSTVGKLEQSYTPPTPIMFFNDMQGRYDYDKILNRGVRTTVTGPSRGPLGKFSLGSTEYRERLRSLIEQHTELYKKVVFPGPSGKMYDQFLFDTRMPSLLRNPDDVWFMRSPNGTMLNAHGGLPSYDVELVPWHDVQDYLVLVSSYRASAGIFNRGPRGVPGVMLSRSEPDPLIRGGQIEAIGRYLLLDVINPSPSLRLVLDFTATLNADGKNRIPPVSVIGTRRESFEVHGRGAARLVSPPLTPKMVRGLPMIELDMGTNGEPFRHRRRGLLALFGAKYGFDPRRLVGYVRDISVISEADYQRLRAPSALASFPGDLRNRALRFSGMYEDGWASEHVVVWLTAPAGARNLTVRGLLPDVGTSPASEIVVKVDGVTLASQPLLLGYFEMKHPASGDGRQHKIEIEFDHGVQLPNGDDRVVSTLLKYIGYE